MGWAGVGWCRAVLGGSGGVTDPPPPRDTESVYAEEAQKLKAES